MTKRPSVWTRIVNILTGARWTLPGNATDPDQDERDAADRERFLQNQQRVLTQLERLEAMIDVRTGRKRDDT